jgi:hypothetical protein
VLNNSPDFVVAPHHFNCFLDRLQICYPMSTRTASPACSARAERG